MASVDQDLMIVLSSISIPMSTRLLGWEYLINLTGTDEGIERIISFKDYGRFLGAYIKSSRPEDDTKDWAYQCLLNLSSYKKGSCFILSYSKGILQTLLSGICDTSDWTKIQCSILGNLSNFCDLLNVQGFIDLLSKLWKEKLAALFCSSDSTIREQYAYLALLFSNLSATSVGKKFLIEDNDFFSTFLTSLDPEEADPRRMGMALTFRNCCTEMGLHEMLLKNYNILPVLLKPLMEGGKFDEEEIKKLPPECQEGKVWREGVPQIRKAIVHALSMLCYTEDGWNHLKSHGVYYVCREFHLIEPDKDVKEAVETLVGYMLVDAYSNANLEPTPTDKLQDIPDFLVSSTSGAEKLPVSDALSSTDNTANSNWHIQG